MKEVLIITSYFPPETGAASNRIYHLAEGLEKRNFKVSVITPLPNYPTGKVFQDYKGKFKHTSIKKNITIYRLWIYASNSKNKLVRLFAMLSYSFSLLWFFAWNTIPKKVIIQSPPLLVAFTSMLFLRSKNRKLILNVSDLWPIAGLELGVFKKNSSYKLLERIEFFNYKNADVIFGQSKEILNHVTSLIENKEVFLYRNYPDFETPKISGHIYSGKKIKIVYAGLLGVAQGIYKLCQKLEYENIEFHVYGAGSERQKIEKFIENNPELPIIYHGQVSRQELHKLLLQYHIALIPLLNRIYGSVPSKIFEYAKLGLPILYFGGGEGEGIIKNDSLGWIAKSGNYKDLNTIISNINVSEITVEMKNKIKVNALKKYNLSRQLDEVKNWI